MYQKKCRLTRAARYYGKGGGGGSVPATVVRRNLSAEWPKVINKTSQWYGKQYPDYTQNEPILNPLYKQAQAYMGAPSITQPSPLLKSITSGARGQLDETSPLLKEMQGQALSDLERRGALSPEEEGRIRASSLATAGQMGMGYSPGTLGTELLNREVYRQGREGIARQYATGVEGLTEQDISRRYGIATGAEGVGQANIGQQLAETGQKFQLPESVLQQGVSAFGQLTNPILDYLGKAFTPQVVGGTAQPSSNKGGETVSAVGSVIGAGITAY